MGMDRLVLGKLIKARRKELKLTAEDLAKKAHINRTYISKIERHGFLPSIEIMSVILMNLKIGNQKINEYASIFTRLKFSRSSEYQDRESDVRNYKSELSIIETYNNNLCKRIADKSLPLEKQRECKQLSKRLDSLLLTSKALISKFEESVKDHGSNKSTHPLNKNP